jgi:HPt (histidine-containing phosphotransfer) domain-containing protein
VAEKKIVSWATYKGGKILGGDNIFNLEKALEQSGDQAMLLEVIDIFTADYQKRFEQIESALKNREGEIVQRLAHSLKAAVGILGAEAAFGSAKKLEEEGKNRDFSAASQTFVILKDEVEQLVAALKAYKMTAGLVQPIR